MNIQVFGTNCEACITMKRNVDEAVRDLGLDCAVEHVTRIMEMIDHGIMSTPALKIDGEIKCVGKALDVPSLKVLFADAARKAGAR